MWFNHINVLHGSLMHEDYARTARFWTGYNGLWPRALASYYHSLFGLYSLFFDERDLGSTAVKEDGTSFTEKELKTMKNAIHLHTLNHVAGRRK